MLVAHLFTPEMIFECFLAGSRFCNVAGPALDDGVHLELSNLVINFIFCPYTSKEMRASHKNAVIQTSRDTF